MTKKKSKVYRRRVKRGPTQWSISYKKNTKVYSNPRRVRSGLKFKGRAKSRIVRNQRDALRKIMYNINKFSNLIKPLPGKYYKTYRAAGGY